MNNKMIGGYARRGLVPIKIPRLLYHDDHEYLMELQADGYYETQMPITRVGKIGVRNPSKKKFTLEQLLAKGYRDFSRREI